MTHIAPTGLNSLNQTQVIMRRGTHNTPQRALTAWARVWTGALVALGVFLMGSSALATPIGQCMDIGALLGIASTEHGRQQAEQLVRQNHPYSNTICTELGWHCDMTLPHSTPEPTDEILAEADCLDEDQGRCKDPDEVPESFAGDLLGDEDTPSGPLYFGDACFDHPTRCGALPAPDTPQTITSSSVPSVAAERFRPDIPQAPLIEVDHLALDSPVGPAAGVSPDIDHPPQG